MAENEPTTDSSEGDTPPSSRSSRLAGRIWKRLLTPSVLGTLLLVSMLGHLVAYGAVQLDSGKATNSDGSTEVGLGQYEFVAKAPGPGDVRRADFSLHIALLDPLDPTVRRRLVDRSLRLRQSVEELLRLADSGDFTNPSLEGLKRRLQERINETVELRVVAEVMITDLRLDRVPGEPSEKTESSDASSWEVE